MVSIVQDFTSNWNKPANLVTEARLLLSPVAGVLVLLNQDNAILRWVATAIFVAVVASDALDGYLARRLNQVSDFGKFLDPTVDKVLVILTFIALSMINPWLWLATIVIAAREVAITVLRVQVKKRGIAIAATISGKLKMVAQSIALALLLAPLSGPWSIVQVAILVIALILTVTSWIEYHRKFTGKT